MSNHQGAMTLEKHEGAFPASGNAVPVVVQALPQLPELAHVVEAEPVIDKAASLTEALKIEVQTCCHYNSGNS